jgi:hypothetical protein
MRQKSPLKVQRRHRRVVAGARYGGGDAPLSSRDVVLQGIGKRRGHEVAEELYVAGGIVDVCDG